MIDLAAQSNVTISALDTRGVYVTQVTASENTVGRSVNLMSDIRRSEMLSAGGTMGALADGTGGTFFHNSNDLAAGSESNQRERLSTRGRCANSRS